MAHYRPKDDKRQTVHPHACGEIWLTLGRSVSAIGPPPRVWGNRGEMLAGSPDGRSTPTRVGKSWMPFCSASSRTVHPHACGEIRPSSRSQTTRRGPPPRVWGNQSVQRRRHLPSRSTPTRVGKSRPGWPVRPMQSVHPHACGEIIATSSTAIRHLGPPPRVWGNLDHVDAHQTLVRSTPTRVGKSPSDVLPRTPLTVHPHACGEIRGLRASSQRTCGPPPRVWGNRNQPSHNVAVVRSTPTRVGKS